MVWGDYSGLAEVCSIGLLLFSYLTVVRLDILGALMTLVLHDNPRRIFPNTKNSKVRAEQSLNDGVRQFTQPRLTQQSQLGGCGRDVLLCT